MGVRGSSLNLAQRSMGLGSLGPWVCILPAFPLSGIIKNPREGTMAYDDKGYLDRSGPHTSI